ncbi:hypothetical protein ElyMa_005476800 [Elysia marginata]|uniref:Uncharacterized protein n=1 Tax=Elysia marginata TaxID=1093978 RepID=A0AAV4ERR4_9GAST|nr:hypothetical protein ElyMa_005476800 [Elysia marginata]
MFDTAQHIGDRGGADLVEECLESGRILVSTFVLKMNRTGPYALQTENYLDFTEPEEAGDKTMVMPIEIAARGLWVNSQSVATNTPSLKTASRSSREQFPLDLEQKKWAVASKEVKMFQC